MLVQPPAAAPFYGPFISRSPCALSRLRLRAGLPCLALVWFGLVRFGSVWFGLGIFLPQHPPELPLPHEPGLAFCSSDFCSCAAAGGVAERGFITIITIFVFLYHVQPSLLLS